LARAYRCKAFNPQRFPTLLWADGLSLTAIWADTSDMLLFDLFLCFRTLQPRDGRLLTEQAMDVD